MKKASGRMLKEDGDDAHFSDNPAVPRKQVKRAAKKSVAKRSKKRAGGRKSKR